MRKVMRRGNFTSVADLEEKLRAFLKYFNQTLAWIPILPLATKDLPPEGAAAAAVIRSPVYTIVARQPNWKRSRLPSQGMRMSIAS
jgi:hypothetical protein